MRPAAVGSATGNRLPRTVVPTHYNIAIRTDLKVSPPSYVGELIVSLDVAADTARLAFHAGKNLTISHVALSPDASRPEHCETIDLSSLSYDVDSETVTLDLETAGLERLQAGRAVRIWFRYESLLEKGMRGYYMSEGDADDQTGVKPMYVMGAVIVPRNIADLGSYALTQFQATAARRAFPCWDEPLLKAKFTLAMIARDSETVLGNMPDISSKPWRAPLDSTPATVFSGSYQLGSLLGARYSAGEFLKHLPGNVNDGQEADQHDSENAGGDGWRITQFSTSPPMSSYLVAFACGNFVHLESEHRSIKGHATIPLRIFTTKNLIEQAQFALDIKKWALPVYEQIFDVPYALPKLDTLVAHDFDAGAMENWGLITGRTTAYLYDPEKSPLLAKKRVAVVQCHELAHMWFGDIVTMKWWDNLWLNEAFATLMGELVILDRIWPEWKPRSQFLNTHLANALTLDSQRSSHPVETDCPDSSYISQIFDAISYSKGASVLRMLMSVVGEDKFLIGVSKYLKKHVYGNAETRDLWEGVSEASGLEVADIMANWTTKVGYPVITVTETADGQIELQQNRFLSTGDVKPEEDETLWWIPLEIKSVRSGEASVNHQAVLKGRSMTYDLQEVTTFKLNAETAGLYRVAYSPDRLARLGREASLFSPEDRVGLVSDAANLARAGHGRTSGAFALIVELAKTETEYLPWSQIGTAIDKLDAAWWEQPKTVRDAINRLRMSLYKPVVERMGYENGPDDSPDVKELRELAVSTCAKSGEPGVINELNRRFAPYLENNDDSRIPSDLQRAIFSQATKDGGEREYAKILEAYSKPSNPSTKVNAIMALCAVQDQTLLDRTFVMLEDGSVKQQDTSLFYRALGSNPKAKRQIAQFFMDRYDALSQRFGSSGMKLLVKGALDSFSSWKDFEQIKGFFANKDTKLCHLAVMQTLDAVQGAATWLERDREDVQEWLRANKFLEA